MKTKSTFSNLFSLFSLTIITDLLCGDDLLIIYLHKYDVDCFSVDLCLEGFQDLVLNTK